MNCDSFFDTAIEIFYPYDETGIDKSLLEDFNSHLLSCDKCQKVYDHFVDMDILLKENAEEIFCDKIPEEVVESFVRFAMDKAEKYNLSSDVEKASECYNDILKLMPNNQEAMLRSIFTVNINGNLTYIQPFGESKRIDLPIEEQVMVYRNNVKLGEFELEPKFEYGMYDAEDRENDLVRIIHEDDNILIETHQGIGGNFLLIIPKNTKEV